MNIRPETAGRSRAASRRRRMNPRTRALLQGPIVPTLLRMAWPNVLIMFAQAATGLIETYWVGYLGTDALAGMALVFPGVMMMQMFSAGAMGGGISSAIARALGAGKREQADALVLHALVINLAIGAAFSAAVLIFGRPLYRLLGGEGASLEAALIYSNVVFGGIVLLWLMNALASVIRGTGNMLVPALVICAGAVALVPLSPLLIFGVGPIPALGIAGGGLALVLYNLYGALVLGWYVLSGRNIARFTLAPLRWAMARDILRVGAVAGVSTVQTNVTVAPTTALVGLAAGPAAVAGFGTAARLEYLLIPLVFGLGGPLVALVGTNIGAGQRERALRIAWTGAALAFVLCEIIGVAAALCAARLAQPVRQRSADDRGGQRLSARGRALLRLLRLRPGALFRLAGRRQAGLAADRGLCPHGGRDRRRLARAAPHRLAAADVRGGRRGARRLRRRCRHRGVDGRLVSQSPRIVH